MQPGHFKVVADRPIEQGEGPLEVNLLAIISEGYASAEDYQLDSSLESISIAPGSQEVIVSVTPKHDRFVEGDEEAVFMVTASNDGRYSQGGYVSASVTIQDNDHWQWAPPEGPPLGFQESKGDDDALLTGIFAAAPVSNNQVTAFASGVLLVDSIVPFMMDQYQTTDEVAVTCTYTESGNVTCLVGQSDALANDQLTEHGPLKSAVGFMITVDNTGELEKRVTVELTMVVTATATLQITTSGGFTGEIGANGEKVSGGVNVGVTNTQDDNLTFKKENSYLLRLIAVEE